MESILVMEHGFVLVTEHELDVALEFASHKPKGAVTLNRIRLRRIANDAGKNFHNAKVDVREATERALKAFEREFKSVRLTPLEWKGYKSAVGKILGERNPNTRAVRAHQAEVEEIIATSYGIEKSRPIDPQVNREIAEGLTGQKVYELL